MRCVRNRQGFTLIEVTVSAVILLAVTALAMRGFMYLFKASDLRVDQNELDVEVHGAIERVKRDLRLSSLDKMFYFPAGVGPYKAMSFPLARDDDGDGVIDVDADRQIIWDQTLIYHRWDGAPTQLRLTTFDPRDESLTDAERQAQIDSVVIKGHGEEAPNGKNARTTVVFENVFSWRVSAQGSVYDGYDTTFGRQVDMHLGSVILGPGEHTLKFAAIGKNARATNYKIGLDSFIMTPSGCRYEAEDFLPATSYTAERPYRQYRSDGSWDGNHQLLCEVSEAGDSFEVTMHNDEWVETNFRQNGQTFDGVVAEFDASLYPRDFVLRLEGNDVNWKATEQTGDVAGQAAPDDALAGCAVRVLIAGAAMTGGGWIRSSGSRCKVLFRAGDSGEGLHILGASIAQCAGTNMPTADATGPFARLTFDGNDDVSIDGGKEEWSDFADFPIDSELSYLVTYIVTVKHGEATPWTWTETELPGARRCYVLPPTRPYTTPPTTTGIMTNDTLLSGIGSSLLVNSDLELGLLILGHMQPVSEADAFGASWGSLTNVMAVNVDCGVAALFTSHPEEGTYTSAPIGMEIAPMALAAAWTCDIPSGCRLGMKVRMGSLADLSDAPAWTNLTEVTNPSAFVNQDAGRYLQYQILMTPNSTRTATPLLRDVSFKWPGAQRIVDVAGTFTKGSAYGIFEMTVDGQKLQKALVVDLELMNDQRGFNTGGGDYTRLRSSARVEVTPRNTGR